MRTWKREMAVSRRYNNVTLCGNVLFYVSICFSFFSLQRLFPFILPHCLNACACCLHIFTFGFVCVSVCVRALWNVIQIKRMRESLARRFLSLFFFILFLIFVFMSLFFTRIHIKYDCSSLSCCCCYFLLLTLLDMCATCRGAFFPFFLFAPYRLFHFFRYEINRRTIQKSKSLLADAPKRYDRVIYYNFHFSPFFVFAKCIYIIAILSAYTRTQTQTLTARNRVYTVHRTHILHTMICVH